MCSMEHWKTHSAIGTKASALSLTKPRWPSQHDQPTTLHALHSPVRRVIGAMMQTPALVRPSRPGKLANLAGPIKGIAAQKGIPGGPPIDPAPPCRYHK